MDTLKVSATFGVFELGLLQLNKKYLYSGIKKRVTLNKIGDAKHF